MRQFLIMPLGLIEQHSTISSQIGLRTSPELLLSTGTQVT
jgi:hypothetical protein